MIKTLALLCALAASASAGIYYVDPAGNDSNDGLTPQTAWETIARASQPAYQPGDQILLKRGIIWVEPGFKASGNGTATLPIVLADYGDPAAPAPVIVGLGAHEPAVLLQNVQHWVVRNLELTQRGQAPQALDPNNEKGKDADRFSDEYMRAVVHVLGLNDANCPNCGVRGIVLENLVVRDGSWNGIYVSGGYYQLDTGRFGYADGITIRNVESFNHHKAGIEITCTYYKTPIYAASNVMVLDSYLHHNGGDGVMVGPVRTGLLDGNLCEFNGLVRNARLGCWTWDSTNTTIQFNESRSNQTPLTNNKARDGGGFDLDLGTEDGMMQYNWSHDNEGEGFLLDSWPVGFGYSRGASHNVQMRYNISERDGKKLSGGITIFGGVAPAVIYNNTIYYEADRLAGSPMFQAEGAPFTSSILGKSGKPVVRVFNNIFITKISRTGAVANNFWGDGVGTFSFNNNLWWRFEGGVRFQWGTKAITSWRNWQGKGFDRNGFNADPQVVGPLGAGPAAYRLLPTSLARNAGRVVTEALRGMGPQDAFGTSTPQEGRYDIGAAEFVP